MKKVILSAFIAATALAVSCSTGEQSLISAGDKSKMDSLSYSLGANVAYTIGYQMVDIPFDYDAITKGLSDAAFGKNTVTSEQAMQTLQTYFTETRVKQAEIVEQKRAEADAAAFANGADTAAVLAARAALKADADMFESEAQRYDVSYAFGIDLGTNIGSIEIPVQIYWVSEAMLNIRDDKALLNEEQSLAFLQNYFTVVRPAKLKEESDAKLAEIAKKSGVVTTESGLMYRIEVEGDMSAAAKDDRDAVNVNYTGRLLRNNKVFDTSRYADRSEEMKAALQAQDPDNFDQDKPIEFPLNRVIPGWTEGMKLVGKGGRISLWIPAELAYGERGAGRDIGPNEALFFDVEILDVIPFEEPATPAE